MTPSLMRRPRSIHLQALTHRFGITSTIPPYLPVALGSAEITLIEQTSAFSVFPDDGVRTAPRYIKKVTDYDGRVLEEDFPDIKDVVSSRTARVMTSMLREVALHGTAAAAAKMPFPVAGKTGTTNDFTDAWFMAGKDPGEFSPPPASQNPSVAQKVDTPDVAPGDGETH